jgi:hypothetical protein
VLNVESAIKAQNLKASQHQPARQTPAVDSGHSTFESMLDDNAANASAAAKDKDKTQNAATDRTQKGPEPKDKSDKPATDSKPTGDQPAPKTTAVPDKTQETVPSETPVVVVKKTDDPDTDADVDGCDGGHHHLRHRQHVRPDRQASHAGRDQCRAGHPRSRAHAG